MPKKKIVWSNQSEHGDYDAALAFLSLIYSAAHTKSLIKSLRAAPVIERTAKDLLRASELPLLPPEETKVKDDLKRIAKGKPLAPVLLIAGDMTNRIPLVVADGYHRICAACHFDEDATVHCRMVSNQPTPRSAKA